MDGIEARCADHTAARIARPVALAAALSLALALAGCASSSRAPRDAAHLTGTLVYREPIALPPSARVEIQLVELRDDGEQEPLVAERLMDQPGPPPIAFSLPYDPRSIDASRTYALRARIRADGELWFASPFDVRVLTAGNPSRVEILLDRVTDAAAVSAGRVLAPDPDPPGLDPRVAAVRQEARAIDTRLDRFDMREVVQGAERLQLWVDGERPVKLVAADTSGLGRSASYYFRDGELFWVRSPSMGWVFEGGALVLRTDGKLQPLAGATGGAAVLGEVESRLALFGL
ncbi:MAG: hypothetical protein DCC71_00445 [Proteobacteria bacterium]|nr:MAG: hypothetical protein DCC71_00445 [Pseudomonadota bacterium]